MAHDRQLGFFLLRYVPDTLKGEFVNIGVVLVGSGDAGYADIRLTQDWRRVRCLDPDVDIEMLQALEREIRTQLTDTHDRSILMKRLQDSFSTTIQLSETKACLGEEPELEIEKLAEMYLQTSLAAGHRELSGRRRILSLMRSAFEQAGVWELMRKEIPAAQYTHKGDPLKIDCGYRPNGDVKLFQAVSLASSVDAAKVLAFSYPEIRAGMAREENAQALLTAIIEDELNLGNDEISFALTTMKNANILIARTADMSAIADEARRELSV